MSRPPMKVLALVTMLGLAACAPSGAGQTAGADNPGPTSGAASPAASAGVIAQPTTSPSADATAGIVVRDFELDPSAVSIAGSTVGFAVRNEGPTVHNVTVRDAAGTVIVGTRDLRQGESDTVAAAIPPGSYVLFCSLPGHESLGIKGTLTVTAP